MRTWHKAAAGAGALVLAAAGYATLDVYNQVPGVLTLASATPSPAPVSGRPAAPRVEPPSAPAAPAAIPPLDGPTAVPAKVAARLAGPLKGKNLTRTVAVSVRDAATGAHLFDRGANRRVTPASVTKLLSAWAISHTMNLTEPLTTRVVAGAPGHVVLVAGGDTVLAPGHGNPDAVAGHAGLADLAQQVARAVRAGGRRTVTLDLDTGYAPGPLTVPGWDPSYLSMGFTARIAQLGLATERADPYTPAAKDPPGDVLRALAKNLRHDGISVRIGHRARPTARAPVLGAVRSAPLIDVLGLALQDSDNAMIESLTRQAAFRAGVPGDNTSLTRWVVRVVGSGGISTRGVHLADVCGLAAGTTIPARVLADVLTSGTTGRDPAFQEVLSRLAVGGWDGTLDDRFRSSPNTSPAVASAAGLVRAKTGSLPKVSSLAGTVVDRDGRLLVFVLIANGAFPDGPWGTRAALDRVVAALAACGCS